MQEFNVSEYMTARGQRIFTIIINIATLITMIAAGFVYVGKTQEQHAQFANDIQCLERRMDAEETERRAEYMRLEIKLNDMDIRLSDISVGQDWIIMKLKGEI